MLQRAFRAKQARKAQRTFDLILQFNTKAKLGELALDPRVFREKGRGLVGGIVERVAAASAGGGGGGAAAAAGGDSVSPTGKKLPPNWRCFTEGNSTWYVNLFTGQVQWAEPPPAPETPKGPE
jgi:hypothetical protein